MLDRIVISFPSLDSDGKMRFDFSGKEESVRLKKYLLSSKQFNNYRGKLVYIMWPSAKNMNPGQVGSQEGDRRARKCLTLGVGDLCCLSESFLSALNPPVPRAVAAREKTVQACFSSMQITA